MAWIGGVIFLVIFMLIFGTLSVVLPASVADTAALLAAGGYVADTALATTVFLALSMQRPLFLEGEPGTGKTEIAKVLASGLGRRLVRLQCYDGLDLSAAAYEWDHARQLMAIRIAEAAGEANRAALASDIYAASSCMARPLLSAIDPDQPPAVLLIDELDRADEPFEAFLLEVLADFQLTVPEYGTMQATTPPVVVLTSNRTREVHDAIRRRCLYHWVDYPDAARERMILARKAPGLSEKLSAEIVAFVQRLRTEDLFKLPGRGRDDRLGGGAAPSRPDRARAGGGRRDAGRAAEISGRYRQDPRRRGGAAGGGGAAPRPRRARRSIERRGARALGPAAGQRDAFRPAAAARRACRSGRPTCWRHSRRSGWSTCRASRRCAPRCARRWCIATSTRTCSSRRSCMFWRDPEAARQAEAMDLIDGMKEQPPEQAPPGAAGSPRRWPRRDKKPPHRAAARSRSTRC